MADAGFCTKCGAPRRAGAAFCPHCGTPYQATAPAPPASVVPQGSAPPPPVPPAPPPPVSAPAQPVAPARAPGGARPAAALRSKWLPIFLVGFIAYLDYLTHSDSGPAVQIVVGSIVVVLILFGHQIGEQTGLSANVQQIPPRIRPILLALPPMLWFLIRDEGTSGAGFALMVVSLGLVAVVSFLGPQIDAALARFYTARDRALPRGVRVALVIVLPILLSALIVHGSLASIAVLFQGTTSSPKSAQGQAGLIVFAALASAVVALLLLREEEA